MIKNHGFRILLGVLLLLKSGINSRSICNDEGGHYRENEAYAENLKVVLSSLALNITLDEGFFNGTVGKSENDPNRVYAVAVCIRGRVRNCYNCITSLIQDLATACPNQTRVFAWDAVVPCMLRYSDRPLVGILGLEPVDSVIFNHGSFFESNLAEFNRSWNGVVDRTLMETVPSLTNRSRFFGTERETLTRNETVYMLMLCNPDITPKECDECLRASVQYYQGCCHGKKGGAVVRPSCVFRWDLQPFYGANFGENNESSILPPIKGKKNGSKVLGIIIGVIAPLVAISLLICCFLKLKARKKKKIGRLQFVEDGDDLAAADSLRFDIATIIAATDNFSSMNELGRGGFGSVYKGTLWDGQEIAVKRLSQNSGQGDNEFKTEVLLVAKLQHRNLVRLLGFCLEGNERVLVYEFVANSSLDHFLFDPLKRKQLDWESRSKIIQGIARGLLYLHEDSRLRIIHRDLKAGNILLDQEMCPKIADFGLARLFGLNETQGSTNKIVGTYGYMAPEYAMHGHFSVKTDVFSYGVLVLEILSGRKNMILENEEDEEDLLNYAWRSWTEGKEESFVDSSLRSGPQDELKRCINIGLLCVQDNVDDRPTMAVVVNMLNSDSLKLQEPSRPALFKIRRRTEVVRSKSSGSRVELLPCSMNQCSVTDLHPR